MYQCIRIITSKLSKCHIPFYANETKQRKISEINKQCTMSYSLADSATHDNQIFFFKPI